MVRVVTQERPQAAFPPPALGLESTTITSFLWGQETESDQPTAPRERLPTLGFSNSALQFNCQLSYNENNTT